MFINRYFATRPEWYFFLILSRAPLICFIVVYDTIASSTVFYYVVYRMPSIFIRTKQRFLSVSRVSWMAHRVIIYCRAELRRRSRYGNARRQTENGIYARNRDAGEEDGASNQTDRSSCFRSGTKPFHLFVRLAFFFLVFRRTRTTIDTWRGRRWRGRRSREPALDKEERESERAKRRKRGSRVAPHILLISVSIVVSVGTPSLRARGAGWRGTIHHLVLPFAHVPLFSFSSSSSSYSLLLTLVVPDLSHSLHRRSLLAIMASFPLKREKR